MQTEIETATCDKCRKAIVPETKEWNKGLCDACYTWSRYREDRRGNEEGLLAKSVDERISNWNNLCPSQYRDNDVSLIDNVPFEAVTKWKFSNRGILCGGESQRGKTTSCWRLLERIYVMQGISFEAFTEPGFSNAVEEKGRSKTLEDWIKKLCNIQVLFIDDIGHVGANSKHLEKLYYVIETRTSWKRPIIATTQFNLTELTDRAKRWGGDKTTAAILNRLKAHCELVEF